MNQRSPAESALWRFVSWGSWILSGAGVLTGLLVVYGVILPRAFTQILALAGRHSLRFENPVNASRTLKELIFALCFVFAAASANLVMRYLRKRTSDDGLIPHPSRVPTVAALSLCVFLVVYHFGLRHFAPYDESATLDLGWRLALGQRPYGQFFNQFPPGHYLPLKFAFQIFGASWRSMVLLTAFASAGAFIWSFALLRRITTSVDMSVMIALATVSTTGIMFSFWWYNPITTLAGCIFLVSAIALAKDPTGPGPAASYFFALIIISLMKPNVAAVLIVLVTLVLAFSSARRRMLIISLAAFVAGNLVLFVNHATLLDVIHSYVSIERTGRFFIQDIVPLGLGGISIPNLIGDSFFIILPLALVLAGIRGSKRGALRSDAIGFALCAAGMLSGFLGLATNMELFISDGTLIILAALIFLTKLNKSEESMAAAAHRRKLILALCSGIVIYGTSLGAVRLRQWIVGPAFLFHEVTPSGNAISYPYFKGLTTGENFGRTMAAIQAVVERYPRGRIFFDNTYAFAAGVFGLVPVTIDVEARQSSTPRIWPIILPPNALLPRDSLDAIVCSYRCEEASKKVGLVENDSLTIRGTKPPFTSDVFVYTRPVSHR